MSLATRCPACHTVFRVVQDQLRVSEGWVRCGQCQEVFNALESLFDLDTAPAPVPAPAPVSPPSPPSPPPPAAAEPSAVASLPHAAPPPGPPEMPPAGGHAAPRADESAPAVPWTEDDDALAEALARELAASPADNWAPAPPAAALRATDPAPSPEWPQATDPATDAAAIAAADFAAPAVPRPAAPLGTSPMASEPPPRAVLVRQSADADAPAGEPDAAEPTPSRFMGPMPSWAGDTSALRRGRGTRRSRGSDASPPPGPEDDAPQAPPPPPKRRRARGASSTPAFVRQAERDAAWQRPAVRAGLGAMALLLSVSLAGQAAYRHRDTLAAREPAWAPVLAAGCQWLGCELRAPLALDPLRLEASDLVRTERDQVLRLTADLHNTAGHAVRRPALDVSFTDASGRLLARRVFPPGELGATQEALDAGGTWRIDALLAVGPLPIAGYTVEVFYP
ncbi:zinc-ribbon and DUF3426 domain-containing protein [Ideonella sp.]|uniref:zinc-ribbon and DUF3426 domain-containing protein n=1 Tax=Ideonella sp. TaxID=1929293 RepID=UPI0035B3B2F4